MKISILTLFPEMFAGPFDHSIIKRAKDKKLVEINFVNIRDFGIGRHRAVDDTPYGGGVGMVLRVDVIVEALESVIGKKKKEKTRIVMLSASGKKFTQEKAQEFSEYDHLILICGHYEGIDARINQFIDEEISIGDYVLTGGELPAMVITDSVSRLLTGVLKKDATFFESFSLVDNARLLEHPQYTKPDTFRGHKVPSVLISGHHKKIDAWKKTQREKLTKENRSDILTVKKES